MGPLITSQQTKERRDWAWTRKSYKAFPPLPITSSSWSPTPKRAPPIGNSVSKHWSGGGERGGTFHTQTLTMPTVIALPFSNWMAIFPMFLCQGRTRRNNWVSMCEATAALPGTVLQLYESPTQLIYTNPYYRVCMGNSSVSLSGSFYCLFGSVQIGLTLRPRWASDSQQSSSLHLSRAEFIGVCHGTWPIILHYLQSKGDSQRLKLPDFCKLLLSLWLLRKKK